MSENEERFTPEQLQAIANIKQAMDDTKIIQQGSNGEASSVGIYDEILAERNGEKLEETLDPDELEAKKMLGRVKFLLSAKIENATRNEDFPPADTPEVEPSVENANQEALEHLKQVIKENIEALNPETNPSSRSNAELYKTLASFAASEEKSR